MMELRKDRCTNMKLLWKNNSGSNKKFRLQLKWIGDGTKSDCVVIFIFSINSFLDYRIDDQVEINVHSGKSDEN